MRLIKHMLIIKLNDTENNELLVNTLTGKMFIITAHEAELIRFWRFNGYHEKLEDMNSELAELLKENGFVMTPEQEKHYHDKLLGECRQHHNEICDKSAITVFVITYMCNFNCPYCYENAPSTMNTKIISKDMVDKVFELNGGDLKQISFYGGEPFLPETLEIVKYILSRAPNAEYSAVTNGYYLSDYARVISNYHFTNIMVTLDGPEELHNKTRTLKTGIGTYSKIMSGISDCLNLSIPIKIRMNISPNNIDACEQLREALINRFRNYYDIGTLMFELQPIFQLNKSIRDDINMRLLFDEKTPAGLPYKKNMMSLTLSPLLSAFINNSKKRYNPRYCNCDAEGKRYFYDPEGNIYSCILALNNSNAIVGHYYPNFELKENSFLTRNIESVPQCSKCILKFVCGGGCAYSIIDNNGNVMKPNCEQIINELYYEIPTILKKRIETRTKYRG